VPEHTVIIAA